MEYERSLAEKLGTAREAVRAAARRGWDKIYDAVGEDNEDAHFELVPMYYLHNF